MFGEKVAEENFHRQISHPFHLNIIHTRIGSMATNGDIYIHRGLDMQHNKSKLKRYERTLWQVKKRETSGVLWFYFVRQKNPRKLSGIPKTWQDFWFEVRQVNYDLFCQMEHIHVAIWCY